MAQRKVSKCLSERWVSASAKGEHFVFSFQGGVIHQLLGKTVCLSERWGLWNLASTKGEDLRNGRSLDPLFADQQFSDFLSWFSRLSASLCMFEWRCLWKTAFWDDQSRNARFCRVVSWRSFLCMTCQVKLIVKQYSIDENYCKYRINLKQTQILLQAMVIVRVTMFEQLIYTNERLQ